MANKENYWRNNFAFMTMLTLILFGLLLLITISFTQPRQEYCLDMGFNVSQRQEMEKHFVRTETDLNDCLLREALRICPEQECVCDLNAPLIPDLNITELNPTDTNWTIKQDSEYRQFITIKWTNPVPDKQPVLICTGGMVLYYDKNEIGCIKDYNTTDFNPDFNVPFTKNCDDGNPCTTDDLNVRSGECLHNAIHSPPLCDNNA